MERIRGWFRGLVRIVRNYTNPLYYLRKLVEDLRSARHAIVNWNMLEMRDKPDELAKAFRGKFLAVFFLAGPFAVVAMAISTVVQFQTRDPFLGLILFLALTQILCTIAFQVLWMIANARLYMNDYKSWWPRIKHNVLDVFPAQWTGFQAWLVIYLVAIPLNTLIIFLLKWTVPDIAHYVPMGPVAGLIDVLLFQPPFIRAMGDIFEKHSHVLARRYCTGPAQLAS